MSEHLALKKVGRRYAGLCPFHQEKTASFYVNPELALFHCFGCGASGDAITFIRDIEHLDFADAVERLAARVGVQLRYDDRRAGETKSRQARLREVVAAAIEFHHQLLLESDDAGPRLAAGTSAAAASTATRPVASSSVGRPTSGTR